MNFLTRIQMWLQSITQSRNKMLIIVPLVIVALIFILILFLSSSRPKADPDSNILPDFQAQVTEKNFSAAANLEQVDSMAVGFADKILFLPDNKVSYLETDFKLRVAGQTIASSPTFVARTLYNTASGIIINQDARSSLYNNKEFVKFADNIFQVTPVLFNDEFGLPNNPGYIFMSKKDKSYSIQSASDIKLSQNLNTLATFTLNDGFSAMEIRVLNNTPYLVLYQTLGREGNIEFWQINNNQVQKVQAMSNVQSINFGSDKIVYTDLLPVANELTSYRTTIIDFKQNPRGSKTELTEASTNLARDSIFGSLLAGRCAFGIKSLYCVVKESKVNSTISSYKDIVVKYDFDTKQLTYPYRNIVFSAQAIHVSNNDTIYIVGQQNRLLYRLR